jgi:hypothetical protein
MSGLALDPLDCWFDILPWRVTSTLGVVWDSACIVILLAIMEALRRIEDPSAVSGGTLPAWLSLVRLGRSVPMRGLITLCYSCILLFGVLVHTVIPAKLSKTHTGGLWEMLMVLGAVGLLFLLYAIEVNPLPPGTNRLSEWVKSLTTRLVPAPVPVR